MENLIAIYKFPVLQGSQTNEFFCTQLKEVFNTRNFQLYWLCVTENCHKFLQPADLAEASTCVGQAVKIVWISVSSWNGFDFKIQERNSGNKARNISVKKWKPNFKGWGFFQVCFEG